MQILEREGEENEALHKMMASEQKTSLQNLFHDKCRPCLGSWPQVREGGWPGGAWRGLGEVFGSCYPSRYEILFHLWERLPNPRSLGPRKTVPALGSRCRRSLHVCFAEVWFPPMSCAGTTPCYRYTRTARASVAVAGPESAR